MSDTAGSRDGPETSTFTILLLGDLMIGRLVDALLPTSIAREQPASCPEHAAQTVDKYIIPKNPQLKSYDYLSPWGNAGHLIRSSDGVVVNLETALTTTTVPWPGKVFNYRSHPGNVRCLVDVGLGGGSQRASVCLANNHTLDWNREGLLETVQTLTEAGIEFAGAGRTKEEASQPGTIKLGNGSWLVKCWSFSDHPADWRGEECFNLIDYTRTSRDLMRRQITTEDENQRSGQKRSTLKVVSVHWGPNYRWQPSQEIVSTAHWLIDECDVDIIHGHSSHHIQGVEVYKGKLIVYGCGDFVDDYAVDSAWRNDLSAAWRVTVGETTADRLAVKKLEVFPNRIQKFQARLLEAEDEDHKWVETKFRELCATFHTVVDDDLGPEAQLVIGMEKQRQS
ncbi:uncharacterized protein PV06_06406 [Exophiala oligosperma]|uniref:Capsule synthesis protein CapA domain-containing protein n=2 Tax=Chaetothyriales TaxID=34395 RepID=A0A0D2BZN3_9EURO|nr:uncharacterized protein PV06_06406 [Exophiala oligosperma]KAJ9624596.1 hypothetical protein H2204_010778 [Knufia peltigerae]KIW42902.1 hypothetical protein PV06_06406 [Exophiala oligosperma]